MLPDKAKGLVFDICHEYSPNKMNITEENTRTDYRYGRQRSMSRVPNSQNLRNVPVFIQIFQNTLQRTMLADEFKGSLCPNTCQNQACRVKSQNALRIQGCIENQLIVPINTMTSTVSLVKVDTQAESITSDCVTIVAPT